MTPFPVSVGILRDRCLNRWWFESLPEARDVIHAWVQEYNRERPHDALNGLPPTMFAAQWRDENATLAA